MSQRQDGIFSKREAPSIIAVMDGNIPMSAWMKPPYRLVVRRLEQTMPWALTIGSTVAALVAAARGI